MNPSDESKLIAEVIAEASTLAAPLPVVSQVLASDSTPDESSALPAESDAESWTASTVAFAKTISHYQITHLLGRGGMGEVYQAVDEKLGRLVAIKTLAPELVHDSLARQRFLREARAASRLSHPGICTIYEVGQHENTVYIAMQHIQGQTLHQKLVSGSVSLEAALAYALNIAEALHEAHQARIVHRDIKPSNVMINERNEAVVLDFGLAKQIQADPSAPAAGTASHGLEDLTTHLGLAGTVPYMSPEQVRMEPLDGRSDIFSFGVMLYEMLTRQRPFKKANAIDTLHQILHEEPPPVNELNAALPSDLARIVQKAMAKDRQARYQTLAEFKDDLIEVIHANDYVVRGVSLGRSSSERQLTAKSWQEAETMALPKVVTSPNANTEAVKTAQTAAAVTVSHSRNGRNLWFGLAAGALLSGLAWLWFGRNQPADISLNLAALKTTELVNWTSTPGEVYSAGTFSPDGKHIAYASTQSGTKSIWVKQVKEGSKGQQVTADEFTNDNPIWSPDGEEIAYFSLRGNHYGIWRIPYLGGNPTELAQVEEGSVELCGWAKSNTIYYQSKGNLFALDVTKRTVSQITKFDYAKAEAAFLRISPDEKHIAYRGVDEKRNNTLWVMPKGAGKPVAAASHPADIRNIVWHPDGKRLLYSANVEGNYQVYLAYTDGRSTVAIPTGMQETFVLDVSQGVSGDGAKILIGSSKEESDVWGVNLAKPEEFPVATEINAELWPAVSPDGKMLAFQSIRNLSQGNKLTTGGIVTKAVKGSEQFSELTGNGYLPQWSPDGRQLAFLRLEGKTAGIFRLDYNGGKESLIASGLPMMTYSILPYNRIQTSYFQWSPDGRKLVYYSRKNGQQNLWLVNADGSEDRQLTQNTDANLLLHCPIWSADSQRIGYVAKTNKPGADGKVIFSLWVIDVLTGEGKLVHHATMFINLLGWSADGNQLLWVTPNYQAVMSGLGSVGLSQTVVSSGATQTITNLSATYPYNIHLSPDRQRIAYAARPEGRDNLWVLPSSGGAAQKLTANQDARLYFSSMAWAPDGKTIYFGRQSRYSLLTMIGNLH